MLPVSQDHGDSAEYVADQILVRFHFGVSKEKQKIIQDFEYYGDGILQQTHDGTNLSIFYYYFMEGTSPAAALVSGVAALVLGKSASISTSQQVEAIFSSSTKDLGPLGWDQYLWMGVGGYL